MKLIFGALLLLAAAVTAETVMTGTSESPMGDWIEVASFVEADAETMLAKPGFPVKLTKKQQLTTTEPQYYGEKKKKPTVFITPQYVVPKKDDKKTNKKPKHPTTFKTTFFAPLPKVNVKKAQATIPFKSVETPTQLAMKQKGWVQAGVDAKAPYPMDKKKKEANPLSPAPLVGLVEIDSAETETESQTDSVSAPPFVPEGLIHPVVVASAEEFYAHADDFLAPDYADEQLAETESTPVEAVEELPVFAETEAESESEEQAEETSEESSEEAAEETAEAEETEEAEEAQEEAEEASEEEAAEETTEEAEETSEEAEEATEEEATEEEATEEAAEETSEEEATEEESEESEADSSRFAETETEEESESEEAAEEEATEEESAEEEVAAEEAVEEEATEEEAVEEETSEEAEEEATEEETEESSEEAAEEEASESSEEEAAETVALEEEANPQQDTTEETTEETTESSIAPPTNTEGEQEAGAAEDQLYDELESYLKDGEHPATTAANQEVAALEATSEITSEELSEDEDIDALLMEVDAHLAAPTKGTPGHAVSAGQTWEDAQMARLDALHAAIKARDALTPKHAVKVLPFPEIKLGLTSEDTFQPEMKADEDAIPTEYIENVELAL